MGINMAGEQKWERIFKLVQDLLGGQLALTDSENAQRDPANSEEIALEELIVELRRTCRVTLKLADFASHRYLSEAQVDTVITPLREVNPKLRAVYKDM